MSQLSAPPKGENSDEDEGGNAGVGRRAVLGGLVAVATVGGAQESSSRALQDHVAAAAESLASAMQALHGGKWIVRINHKSGYAAVSRDFS